jgi:predicted small secreted protein
MGPSGKTRNIRRLGDVTAKSTNLNLFSQYLLKMRSDLHGTAIFSDIFTFWQYFRITHRKSDSMKKIFVACLVLLVAAVVVSGCAPTRRGTGCPMTDKIIH